MSQNPFHLMTAVDAEVELGSKYFYRQRTYRYQKSGKLKSFSFRGQQCFLPHKILEVYINELKSKILSTVPELKDANVFYDENTKRMVVDGIGGKYIEVKTDLETEEDLITKLHAVREWLIAADQTSTQHTEEVVDVADALEGVDNPVTTTETTPSITGAFPKEIKFIRIQAPQVEGVEVKSFILFSLPSVANFIGVETSQFSEWVQRTTIAEFVVSAHPRQIHGPGISGPFKKGFSKGLTPLVPFELIPEMLVAFRQSNVGVNYPARAEQLYMMAKSTLEALGLAISGNEGKAAAELAKVSEGLGISAADQVIEIFKRYESRPFQIKEHRRFSSKVKSVGQDYSTVTGEITFGVTGSLPGAWKARGEYLRLPSKHRTSGREVMRTISPADSVGVTFSESHYIKNSTDIDEVVKTGKQGRAFYKRLKDVGLLDD